MKISEYCLDLRDQGFDACQIVEFLEDGEALKSLGFTDKDKLEIETLYWTMIDQGFPDD